ncbi:MAG: hypothetical protein IH895_00190 [Planctomycetes bacterium]|nr:hypothetical protein [Planctomycetota bacterium]
MNSEKVIQLESEFLSGMEVNFEKAKGQLLRGSRWRMGRQDEADRLRSLMARHKKFDRRLLSQTPKNRRVVLHGYTRPWYWFGKKRVGVAIASVLSPIEWHVLEGQPGQSGPPIGSTELLDHVRSLHIDPHVPHIIGICSPTGYTPDALEARPEMSNVTLVLVEPAEAGGWRVVGDTSNVDSRLIELFDPEDVSGKVDRVADYVEANGARLLTGGMSAQNVAERLGVPLKIAEQGFEKVARKDPELHAGRQDGELLIYRGAASEKQESYSMSMVDKIRQLFSRDGDEAQKINELSKRRASLSQRRDRMYDDIGQLEKREADLMEQGKKNKSQVARRRIAAQVAQLRKDIIRHNATTNMLNTQINILSTDIHNLTLIQQGEVASLPSTEELTENAVKAEEMLETLQADADMVGSLDTGISDMLTSDEELAILKEFEEPEAPAKAAPESTTPEREEAKRAAAEESSGAEPADKEKPREPEAT